MQPEVQTIDVRSRREREWKKKEVRQLLEDLYRMEPNTVGKIIDTFFEHDFLPNWYFQYVKVSKKVSKQSYILLRKINDFSNYLRHRGDEEPTNGMAVLLCMTTLELIQFLGNDIAPE